jgi:4-amino-4-deoxy-L-arabinose transferase-like glycosyltransferase
MKPMTTPSAKSASDEVSGGINAAVGLLRPALILIAAVLLVRCVYLFLACPYDLSEDEAFYWDWSRNLAWSYNTKGPGIAWSIRAATETFGTSMAAVRMVAVISSALCMLAVACMAVRTARLGGLGTATQVRAGLIGAGLMALMPGMQVTGLIATIDGPYCACWAIAAALALRGLTEERSRWTWIAFGAVVGAGFLFKYTMLMLLVGVVLAAVMSREARARVRSRLAWVVGGLVVMGVVGLLPVLVWNAQHEWATVKHLLSHLGVRFDASASAAGAPTIAAAKEPWSIRFFAEFVAAQIGIVGGAVVVILAAAWWTLREKAMSAVSALVWFSLPLLAMYLGIALIQEAEGNWAIAAFVTLAPLAAVWCARFATNAGLREAGDEVSRAPRWRFAAWHGAVIVGVVTGLGMLRLDLVQKALGNVSEKAAKLVPVGRVIGAAEMAREIDQRLDELRRSTGQEPFVMVQHYGRASQMAFYLRNQPKVVCASSFVGGGRRVQQDFWQDHRPDWPALVGRPAVVVDSFNQAEIWRACFERVTPIGELPGGTRGTRFGFHCEGFKGLSAPKNVGY